MVAVESRPGLAAGAAADVASAAAMTRVARATAAAWWARLDVGIGGWADPGGSEWPSAAGCHCGTLLRGMEANQRASEADLLRARASLDAGETAGVTSGIPLLDHLLSLLAQHAGFALSLDVEPGEADAEVAAAARALGEALAGRLHVDGARGHGSAVVPADEALAHVALEVSGRPLLVSNVDLSDARIAGLGRDLVSRFLEELAHAAGLTLHVRLINGADAEHVLEAIFKALGAAFAQACSSPRSGKE